MDVAVATPRPLHPRHLASPTHQQITIKTPSIVAWMFLAIALVTALAYWDAQRESKAALDDFTEEQVALADSVAASLKEKLSAALPNAPTLSAAPRELIAAIAAVEHRGLVRVLLARPFQSELLGSDGAIVLAPSVRQALDAGRHSLRLTREQAATLDLPARTAVAGLRRVEQAGVGRWGIAIVATALAERDREQRAQWRLVLGVMLASGLVLAFGGYAMRKQRMELELAHQLEVVDIANERDERLVRADKLATMGALATGIAHEVSTPLGVILGRAEQLLPKQPDDRARRAVEMIAEQTERISAVIRGFLALARGAEPALVRCDPAALARSATALVEHRFEKARLRLETDIRPGLPQVACEPRLLEQVLVNLLLNACDACSERGSSVTLLVDGDRERAAFVVIDDGLGISPEVAQRATEPFFTTKPAGKGTGLGLAIAKEIVNHHRGTLTLSPGAHGRGTRVCVELPAVPREDHA